MTNEEIYPLVDLALARRLERTEARGNAEFVETRARVSPESGAEWIEVAGAYAMFDTTASPVTQTFGLGLFETVYRRRTGDHRTILSPTRRPVCHESARSLTRAARAAERARLSTD